MAPLLFILGGLLGMAWRCCPPIDNTNQRAVINSMATTAVQPANSVVPDDPAIWHSGPVANQWFDSLSSEQQGQARLLYERDLEAQRDKVIHDDDDGITIARKTALLGGDPADVLKSVEDARRRVRVLDSPGIQWPTSGEYTGLWESEMHILLGEGIYNIIDLPTNVRVVTIEGRGESTILRGIRAHSVLSDVSIMQLSFGQHGWIEFEDSASVYMRDVSLPNNTQVTMCGEYNYLVAEDCSSSARQGDLTSATMYVLGNVVGMFYRCTYESKIAMRLGVNVTCVLTFMECMHSHQRVLAGMPRRTPLWHINSDRCTYVGASCNIGPEQRDAFLWGGAPEVIYTDPAYEYTDTGYSIEEVLGYMAALPLGNRAVAYYEAGYGSDCPTVYIAYVEYSDNGSPDCENIVIEHHSIQGLSIGSLMGTYSPGQFGSINPMATVLLSASDDSAEAIGVSYLSLSQALSESAIPRDQLITDAYFRQGEERWVYVLLSEHGDIVYRIDARTGRIVPPREE